MTDDNKQGDFYREQFFEELSKKLTRMEQDISDIKSKVIYMYGFAAGIGLIAALVVEWVKSLIHKG